MEEHELSDILLEQVGSKNAAVVKLKRVLVIVILLILLFVVVLLIMKVINKSDEQPQNKLTQTMLEESANIQSYQAQEEDIIEENVSSEITQISPEITEVPPEIIVEEPKQPQAVTTPPAVVTPPVVVIPEPKQPQTQNSGIKNGWYIQVSSSANAPAKSFLDGISKKGYAYQQYKTTVNARQMTKILVGPYSSERDARVALPNVKSDISKDAFIYQVK
ncbi:MAG: SPOR domain-containing protein [Campylobacteraceae bacterium]|jgi:DedD protein|nr:SPOR domain-containing protein [Campylobacteraceae bacterium]